MELKNWKEQKKMKRENENNDSLGNKLRWQDCKIAKVSITYTATTLVLYLIYYKQILYLSHINI